MISKDIKTKLRPISSNNNSFNWIGDKIDMPDDRKKRMNSKSQKSYYKGFTFNSLTIYEGTDVLIKVEENFNEEFCIYEVAKVLKCFNDESKVDTKRVDVQWYTYIDKVRKNHLKNIPAGLPALDGDIEIVKDMWGYGSDIDIESIAGICCIVETFATTEPSSIERPVNAIGPFYVCRFLYKNSNPWICPIMPETSVNSPGPKKLPLKEINANKENSKTPSNSMKKSMKENSKKKITKENRTPKSLNKNVRSPVIMEETQNEVPKVERKAKRKLLGEIDENDERSSKKSRSDSDQSNNDSFTKLDSEPSKSNNKNESIKLVSKYRQLRTDEIDTLLSDEDDDLFELSPKKSDRKRRQRRSIVYTPRKSTKKMSTDEIDTLLSNEDDDLFELSPKKSDRKRKQRRSIVYTPRKSSRRMSLPVTSSFSHFAEEKNNLVSSKRTPKITERLSNSSLKLSINKNCEQIELTPSKIIKEKLKATPKSKTKPKLNELEKTPSSGRKERKIDDNLTVTPVRSSSRVTPKRKGTPLAKLPTRNTPISKCKTDFEYAREQLHVSAVPNSLPCREDEFQQIFSFVEGKLLDSTGGCMYVSGVPGTGKTATVREVVRILQDCEKEGAIPPFQYIEVNAMKLTKPHQLWVQIWENLTGQRVTADHACSLIEKMLGSDGSRQKRIFLLLDELDLLWTRKQDVMYNLFDWSSRVNSRFVIVAIANTMDLPERMMIRRVSSRMGLTRMTFQPYSHQQLQEIIKSRLEGIRAFDSDAIQLVARKVAAISGDARRALDICRRATELAEKNPNRSLASPMKSPQKTNNKSLVGMAHVSEAINEMFQSPKIMAIRRCSQMEKYIIQAIMTEFNRIGIEEAVLDKVLDHLNGICRIDGLSPPSTTQTLFLINGLSAQRIIFMEHSRLDITLRLRLNISVDDVSYALSL